MYRALVPVSDVEDIPTAAYDLHQALTKHNNLDIEAEFPSTLEQYATAASAEQNLNRLAQSHNPGVWELFLVFAGGQAIGQSIVTISQHPPRAVDPASPNVSGWIARPFRQKGHGQFSLEERLKVVTERFGGKAWTLVNKSNTASERNVRQLGFQCISTSVENRPQYALFLWESA